MENDKKKIDTVISKKRDQRERAVNNRTKQIQTEADKKKQDEERIELMTQFMLDPTSSATKLLEKRREMYELQEALLKDKEKFIEKEEQFKKTEEELRNRDDDFHKKIVEYYQNSYEKKLKDNVNYDSTMLEQQETKKKLETSIQHLDGNNNKLKNDLDKLKNIHDSLKKYEDFLKSVKDKHPDNFTDINDIITKYKTLDETYKNLKNEEDKMKREMERERMRFKKEKSEHEARINGIIANIQYLQEEIENKKDSKKVLESEVMQFEANSTAVVSSLEIILLSINNIYDKCVGIKDWTKHEIENYEKADKDKTDYKKRVNDSKLMLKSINSYIFDYQNIIENYDKQKNNN